MQFELPAKEMAEALAKVSGFVERRSTVAILANVLIVVEKDTLRITATDLDMEASITIPCKEIEPGKITIPAHLVTDITRKAPDGATALFTLEKKENRMILKVARGRYQVPVLPSSDFPKLNKDKFASSIKIEANQLLRLFDVTIHATSRDETRYYLQGVYVQYKNEKLRAVATDGHRLAMCELPCEAPETEFAGVIVPRKAVNEARKILQGLKDQQIEIGLSESKVNFSTDGVEIITKLIDGTYPDYDRVIPYQNQNQMDVNKFELNAALGRVSLITMDKLNAVKFTLSSQGGMSGMLEMFTTSENGDGDESLEVAYSGASITTGFNSKYMVEMLGLITGEPSFFLKDNSTAVLVRDTLDDNVLFVLMPLRA